MANPELHTQLESEQATVPQVNFPTGNEPPTQWNEVYGIAVVTEEIPSAEINNPDGPSGTNSSVPANDLATVEVGGSTLAVLSNPKSFWWPDPTGITQGSFHSTPYPFSVPPVTQ